MRQLQQDAENAVTGDTNTAGNYGASASTVSSVLEPFLTRELTNPGGISQQDQTAELSATQGGAGGVAGGLQTKANERAAATGNESGFGASADDIARERMKAAAGGAEKIAGENADVKLKQQQEGAEGLSSLYGTDVNAQMKALGIVPSAVNAGVNAGSHGWFQNMTNLIAAVRGGSQAPGGLPGGGGGGDGSLMVPGATGLDTDLSDSEELPMLAG
jgi:hypothetical protein